MEGIEQAGPALRDVGMAEELAHDMAVLAFHQGVVVAVPGAGLGELDAQFLQQPGDPVVDIVRFYGIPGPRTERPPAGVPGPG